MRTAVEHHMGTAISIAAPDETDPESFRAATAAAYAELRRADETFSPFKPDSPVSRLRDGRLSFADLGHEPAVAEIRDVLALCAELNRASDGAFDAFRVGDPPGFDPSGAVKGWAARRASDLLTAHGLSEHVLNAGGDVQAVGGRGRDAAGSGSGSGPGSGSGADSAAASGTDPVPAAPAPVLADAAGPDVVSGRLPWRVAVADPHRPGRVLTVIELVDGAVATSGTAERGAHVWNPHTRRPATALASVTVTGPDLALADGYATAALAMAGPEPASARLLAAYDWLAALARDTGYQALTVDAHTRVWWTPGLPALAPGLPAPDRAPGSAVE